MWGGFYDAKMQHAGRCGKEEGCKLQNAERRIQDVDCRKDDAGCEILDVCTNAHEVHLLSAEWKTKKVDWSMFLPCTKHYVECMQEAAKCRSRWSGSRLQDTNGNCKMPVARGKFLGCNLQITERRKQRLQVARSRMQILQVAGSRVQVPGPKKQNAEVAGRRGMMQRFQILRRACRLQEAGFSSQVRRRRR
jgi:hypothetical protein